MSLLGSPQDFLYRLRIMLMTCRVYKDDDTTMANILTLIPKGGIETLQELFTDNDLLFLVQPYSTEYGRWLQGEPIQAQYFCNVTVMATDKAGVSGVLMLFKAEKAIEECIEANRQPTGTIDATLDLRITGRSDYKSQRVGGRTLHTQTYLLNWRTS